VRYPELTTREFVSFFDTCFPELAQDKESLQNFETMLEKFSTVIDELLQEKLLLDITTHNPEMVRKLSEGDHKRYLSASARWEKPLNTERLVTSIRGKSTTGNLYEASPELLTLDEVFLLVSYPFSSRMDGAFGYEFAIDGRLGTWLHLLLTKDADEEKAQDLRVQMHEMENRGDFYFGEPLEQISFPKLQEMFMAAVNYLSDVRTSTDYYVEPSGRFVELTNHIADLEVTNSFGELVIDKTHKGTVDDPKHAPYVRYSTIVDEIYEATNVIIAALPGGSKLDDSTAYLQSIGIDLRGISSLDVSDYDEYCILALLRYVYAQERFSDGFIGHFFRKGHILKWIKRLEEIDRETY